MGFALLYLLATNLGLIEQTTVSYVSEDLGVRYASSQYPNESHSYGVDTRNREWRETGNWLDAEPLWLKNGPACQWRRDHQIKLEEGCYRNGERDGQWIYREDDGSIDSTKSGWYENDVKVRD